jgi:hypothetical protein
VSADTNPAEHDHPEVIEVTRELGIDLSDGAGAIATRWPAATARSQSSGCLSI